MGAGRTGRLVDSVNQNVRPDLLIVAVHLVSAVRAPRGDGHAYRFSAGAARV